jgi:hypothetical protein
MRPGAPQVRASGGGIAEEYADEAAEVGFEEEPIAARRWSVA